MKTTLLLLTLIFSTIAVGQNQAKKINHAVLTEDSPLRVSNKVKNKTNPDMSIANMTCTDTLRYVLNKQAALFGTGWQSNFSTFTCWTVDNESFGQTFLQSGGSVTISGVEFYGNNDATNGTTSVTVQASVYNVNGSGVPTTIIGSGSATITSTTAAYRYISLTSPVTVTGNYAIVLKPTNTNGVVSIFCTNDTPGETMDGENLAHYKSNYYLASNGNWVTIPVLTNNFLDFPFGPYDFEPLISPIVSYNITSTLSANPNPVCLGNSVTLTSDAQPAGVLASRMYNYGAFLNHFNFQPDDSTYAWDMDDNSNLIWNTNTAPYTYAAAGTYNATMYALGGFSHLCLDQATTSIVVNPIPSTSFSFNSGNDFCSTGTNPVPVAVSPGGTYSASSGLVLVSASTGEIDLALTPAGTYTLTYNPDGPCSPGTSDQVVTITTAENPNFTYASSNYCEGSANVLPDFAPGAVAGLFSSSGPGLNFISTSTGEINFNTSTSGTYTVTNEIAANVGCPIVTSTFVITINPIPTVDSQTSQILCNGSNTSDILFTGNVPSTNFDWTNSDPSIGIAASGNSDILSFTVINTGSTPVTSILTVTPTAAGCAGTATNFSITVNPNPIVDYSTLQAAACVTDVDITLSGATPAGGTYSGTGVTSGIFSPSSAGTGTFVITYSYTDGNGCSASSSASIVVDPCVGLKNAINDLFIEVYPNPASNILNINLGNNAEQSEITLITVDGKIVYQENIKDKNYTIDISAYARGLYFVAIKSNNKKFISKIAID